jgi:hypothetical protein
MKLKMATHALAFTTWRSYHGSAWHGTGSRVSPPPRMRPEQRTAPCRRPLGKRGARECRAQRTRGSSSGSPRRPSVDKSRPRRQPLRPHMVSTRARDAHACAVEHAPTEAIHRGDSVQASTSPARLLALLAGGSHVPPRARPRTATGSSSNDKAARPPYRVLKMRSIVKKTGGSWPSRDAMATTSCILGVPAGNVSRLNTVDAAVGSARVGSALRPPQPQAAVFDSARRFRFSRFTPSFVVLCALVVSDTPGLRREAVVRSAGSLVRFGTPADSAARLCALRARRCSATTERPGCCADSLAP